MFLCIFPRSLLFTVGTPIIITLIAPKESTFGLNFVSTNIAIRIISAFVRVGGLVFQIMIALFVRDVYVLREKFDLVLFIQKNQLTHYG